MMTPDMKGKKRRSHIPLPINNFARGRSNPSRPVRRESIFSNISKPGTIKDDPEGTTRKVINEYVILKELGSGAQGEVRLCYHKVKKEMFAMKIVNLQKLARTFVSKTKTGEENLVTEIAIMKNLKHENVI